MYVTGPFVHPDFLASSQCGDRGANGRRLCDTLGGIRNLQRLGDCIDALLARDSWNPDELYHVEVRFGASGVAQAGWTLDVSDIILIYVDHTP